MRRHLFATTSVCQKSSLFGALTLCEKFEHNPVILPFNRGVPHSCGFSTVAAGIHLHNIHPHPATRSIPVEVVNHSANIPPTSVSVGPTNVATNVTEHFRRLMSEHSLEPSTPQLELVKKLQVLQDGLVQYDSSGLLQRRLKAGRDELERTAIHQSTMRIDDRGLFGSLTGLFKRGSNEINGGSKNVSSGVQSEVLDLCQMPYERIPELRSLYIWGGVGQGKTMLMDAFYDSTQIKHKTRVHFHNFILDVQQRLHQLHMERQPNTDNSHFRVSQLLEDGSTDISGGWDPLLQVAYQLSSNCRLLCLDEFQVLHIADAMILKRLFEGLLHVRTPD